MKSFIDIFKRNFMGILRVMSFKAIGIEDYAGEGIAFFSWFLCPLTLTFGVFTKSLIDFFSRKEISKNEIGEVNIKIDNISEKQMSCLTEKIRQYYSSKSNSSKELQIKLRKIHDKESSDFAQEISEEKNKLTCDSLREKYSIIDTDVDVRKVFSYQSFQEETRNIETTRAYEIEEFTDKRRMHHNSIELKSKKSAIKDYLNDPHNSGKKTQHIICNFFKKGSIELVNVSAKHNALP